MWKQVEQFIYKFIYFLMNFQLMKLNSMISDASHLPVKPLLPHWLDAISLPFDQEAKCFFEQLESMGFRIEAWTKAPYLCEGDLRQSFYWLVDVVVVLSKK